MSHTPTSTPAPGSGTVVFRRARLATFGALLVLLAACGGSGSDQPSPTEAEPTATATASPSAALSTATPAPGATSTEAPSATSTEATGPVTITDSVGTEVTLDAPAEAIVSLSPTATESLFAIGAGDQVVAVDEFSYYPEEAPVTDLSGYEPNAEAVADHDPDLVVLSGPGDIVGQLAALDIPTVVQTAATSFDDVYTQIEDLGTLTGHHDEAVELTTQMAADLDALVADAPTPAEPLSYFHELSSDFYTVSSATFVGQVYGLFGLVNIADDAAEQAGTDYPQLSPETIIQSNPDLIYLADGVAGESAETVADRPGWGDLAAVTGGNVVVLPPDIPSRWGPRVVEFAEVIAASLEPFAQ